MKLRRLASILLVSILALTATALPGFAEDKLTIAYSTLGVDSDYWNVMERGVAKACEDLGYNYVMQSHNGDETLMVSTCQNFLQQNVAGIVVSPCKPEAMAPVVAAAHAKNVPVVVGDMGDGGSDDDGLVLSDNYGGGALSANYILSLFEKDPPATKKMAVIRLNPEAEISQLRCNSAIDVMGAAGYACAADIYANTGTTEEGYKCMQDIIAANPDLAAVFCGNDRLAVGAAQAAIDAGLTGIKVAGFDADESGVEAVRLGHLACTVQQFSYDIGYQCVVLLDRLIKGETVEYASGDNKEVLVPCALVTAADIPADTKDQVISSTGLTRGQMN